MERERYFDSAATTPVDPRVLREMLPYFSEAFGNANSTHGFGAAAASAVEAARGRVAALIGAEDPSQIVFTSGATEANSWVISAFETGAISPFEHSAVREPALHRGYGVLQNEGVALVPPSSALELASVMSVNNETGTLWNPVECRGSARHLHSDMTQQLGKFGVDVDEIDFASFSAHKLYGPKGVGALYYQVAPPVPFMRGGEQEIGARAGTLNVPGIVGFGAACAIASDEMAGDAARALELRNIVLEELRQLSDWRVNGGPHGVPQILNISFLGVEGETILIEADAAGFAISAGAACSSRSTEPSHVLTALGIGAEWLRGTVRISFGRFNTAETARDLAITLKHSVEKLRRMG